jgi:hypothetical protein
MECTGYPAHRNTPIIRRIFNSIMKGARIDKCEKDPHLVRGQAGVSATTCSGGASVKQRVGIHRSKHNSCVLRWMAVVEES